MSTAVSYETMILSSLGNQIVPSTANLFLTNQSTSSTRFSPYMELIFQIEETDTSYAIYNTFLKYVSEDVAYVETHDASQLIIPPKSDYYYALIYVNDKRYYTCDQQIYYGYTSSTTGPDTLYFKYKNNQKAICKLPNGNAVTPSSGGAYTVSDVNRNSIFTYYSGTTVYLLIDFNNSLNTTYGFTIFIMQSYTTQIYPVTSNNLTELAPVLENQEIVGSGNTIPSNFVYSYLILPKNITLQAVSVETAYLIQDGLNNSYVYLDPSFSNTIYSQYYES
jgi:hypothetical protein